VFSIVPELPEELAIGVFAEVNTYSTWIRFSNALGEINPDNKGDIRGIAIKLMGVSGEKLLPAEKNAQTHDFLLVSTDVFIVKDVAEFADLFKALVGGVRDKIMFFSTHWRVVKILSKAMIKFANPLQIRYFSTTPYLLGESAVKYSVIPQSDSNDKIPSNPSNNFLREAMVRQLDQGEAVFDFCVQFQKDSVQMPIEDPGKLWDETLSPFLKVATITIPRQSFSTPERDELGENLSFTPWHALPEHRPLGGINRARKVVYDLISTFRHKENKQKRQEPVGFDD
jgi:catalase